MTTSAGFGTQWQSPQYVDQWFADEATQADHRRLRAKLVQLLPFEADAGIRVLDLGTGAGALSLEVLGAYPKAQLVCHDFSETMLARAAEQLAKFSKQVEFVRSDFREPAWTQAIPGTFDAVVSSVAIHNVTAHTRLADPTRIRDMFGEIFGLVKPGGCFLNYDHVYPPGPVTEQVYKKVRVTAYQARLKDEMGMERSIQEVERELDEKRRSRTGGEPVAGPPGSRAVQDQLQWLNEAGFDEVDCLWKETRLAIIGGFRHS